jgi:dolichol-phosphate mannosyltransferase
VVRYCELLNQGWGAVFGSRFVKGGGEIDYPWLKLRLNRAAHAFIMLMFGIKLNEQCLQSYIWLEKYFSRGDYRNQ